MSLDEGSTYLSSSVSSSTGINGGQQLRQLQSETASPNPADRTRQLTSGDPAIMSTPRHRLSFSGFPNGVDVENIVAIEDVSDGRRSSMLVRVRGRFSDRTSGKSERRARGSGRCRPLGKLFDDDLTVGVGGGVGGGAQVELLGEDQYQDQDAEAAPYEVQVDDEELKQFCGVVLQLVRNEFNNSTTSSSTTTDEYQQETLLKLREAFNNLVLCSEVPSWLSAKAQELKRDLESQMTRNGGGASLGSAGSAGSAGGAARKPLEMIREDLKSEFSAATELAVQAARDDTEAQWRRKMSFTRKEVAQLKDQEAKADRVGLVGFVKHCMSAISILKEKLEDNKGAMQRAHQDKLQAALQAKDVARKEAAEEWGRRVSMVRRETAQATKQEVAHEFKQAQDAKMNEVVQRVRAEAESDWSRRLREEQKNRRLSAQVKMTLAVERVSQRAEAEKEHALAALAEELEKEKEEATRTATDIARANADQEWKRKLSVGIKEAKKEILQELSNNHSNPNPRQSGGSCSSDLHLAKHQHQQIQFQQHQHVHGERHSFSTTYQVQREEHLWAEQQQHQQQHFLQHHHQQQHLQQSHYNSVRNSVGARTARSSAGPAGPRLVRHNSAGAITPGRPARDEHAPGGPGLSDFSAEFGLSMAMSPVPIALDETAASSGAGASSSRNRRRSSSSKEKRKTPRSSSRRANSKSPREAATPQHKRYQPATGTAPGTGAGTGTGTGTGTVKKGTPTSAGTAAGTGTGTAAGTGTGRTSKQSPQKLAQAQSSPELPFEIVQLAVLPGALKGSMGGRYREYDVCMTVAVGKSDRRQQLRTRKTMRYSAAREALHDRLYREAERLGHQISFQSAFAQFPGKVMGNSNSDATATLRANAIKTYLLYVYDVAAQLARINKADADKRDIQHLAEVVFQDFLN